jgi:hypothetical protein
MNVCGLSKILKSTARGGRSTGSKFTRVMSTYEQRREFFCTYVRVHVKPLVISSTSNKLKVVPVVVVIRSSTVVVVVVVVVIHSLVVSGSSNS